MASTSYTAASTSALQDSSNVVKGYTGLISVHSEPQLSRLAEREYNPLVASPASASRKGKERMVYGDRFIPNRDGNDLSNTFNLLTDGGTRAPTSPSVIASSKRKLQRTLDVDARKEEADKTFNALLRNELLGVSSLHEDTSPSTSRETSFMSRSPATSRYHAGNPTLSTAASMPTTPTRTKNLFSFASPSKRSASGSATKQGSQSLDSPTHEKYSASPVRYETQKMLLSPRKAAKMASRVPFKVLDAPDLADDFYLNLIDWSSTNILAVGLGSCVYLWTAATSSVKRLCDLADLSETIASVKWVQKGSKIAVGTVSGLLRIYDAETQQCEREMTGHSARAGTLAWNDWILSSGSRDRSILHRDVRAPEHYFRRLTGHRQEICGIKWSPNGTQLASGGNDNKLLVWDNTQNKTLFRFSDHTAAVKAIAWNTHQSGILASGGGAADKKIRFWNTLTGNIVSEVDTGSQVCSLLWSKNSNEVVSSHGFSNATSIPHQVCVWTYPSMQQVASLPGHTCRVLYLAMSPDGETVVTGAGDETLRFWNCFSRKKLKQDDSLNPFLKIR